MNQQVQYVQDYGHFIDGIFNGLYYFTSWKSLSYHNGFIPEEL